MKTNEEYLRELIAHDDEAIEFLDALVKEYKGKTQDEEDAERTEPLDPANGQAQEGVHLGDLVDQADACADQEERAEQGEDGQCRERYRQTPALDLVALLLAQM